MQKKQIENFINNYFKNSDKNNYIYISLINRENNTYKEYYNKLKDIHKYINTYINLNKYKKVDIYYSLNTFKKIDNNLYRQKNYVNKIDNLHFDVDLNGLQTKNKIINTLGKPTFTIQTSKNKFQLIYKFKPLKNTLKNRKKIERLNKYFDNYFKSDNTNDITRIYRLPYFLNNKNGFKIKKLEQNNTNYTLKDFYKHINLKQYKELFKIKQTTKTIQKNQEKQEKDYINTKFNKNNKYYKQYLKLLNDKNGDKSRVDMSFYIFLKKRYMNHNNIVKNLIECRKDINKHANLEYYFNKLKEKSQTY